MTVSETMPHDELWQIGPARQAGPTVLGTDLALSHPEHAGKGEQMGVFKRLASDDVVGVFNSQVEADLTRDDLLNVGVDPEGIEITEPQAPVNKVDPRPFETQMYPTRQLAEGSALVGAFIGGILGCLLGT